MCRDTVVVNHPPNHQNVSLTMRSNFSIPGIDMLNDLNTKEYIGRVVSSDDLKS